MSQKMTFTAACRQFFGFLPGQGLSQFAAELKALTHEDKQQLAAGLREVGLDCADPVESATPATA